MKKMTWEAVKEKVKKFVKEHKKECIFLAGMATSEILGCITEYRNAPVNAHVVILYNLAGEAK